MEVVAENEHKNYFKCPRPCEECKPVCKGFKKLNVTDSELIESLRNDNDLKLEEAEREGTKINNEEKLNKDAFVSDRHVPTKIKRSFNNLQEIQPRSKCFHCDSILQQVCGLLDEIKTIKESEAYYGLCQHCKLSCFSGKCKRCYYLINKYLSDKMTHNKMRHQEYKMWLSKLKEVLLSILQSEKVCRHKDNLLDTASIHELENLLKELKEPLFDRDLKIGQFPTSEFKDTFDISESLSESKDILEMVLKKLKENDERLKKEKVVKANKKSSSSSLLSGSMPSLRSKFEMLQSKYAMYQKSMDSDFAFTSDRLELEFKTKIAQSLKQTETTKKVLQFGTAQQQKPKSKDKEVESIMKNTYKGSISLKTGKRGVKIETPYSGNKISDSHIISDEDLLPTKDLKSAQIGRALTLKKQEQDKQIKKSYKESKLMDTSNKISDIKGSTTSELEIVQDTDKEIHQIIIPTDLNAVKNAEKKFDSKVDMIPLGPKLRKIDQGTGSEKLSDKAADEDKSENLLLLAAEEKKYINSKKLKEDSAIEKKKHEESDVKNEDKNKNKTKNETSGKGANNQDVEKGKRKKKKKGKKREVDDEESSEDDEVNSIKKKQSSGVLNHKGDPKKGKENLDTVKPSDSTKLLLKLIKDKEKERAKKDKIKDKATKDKAREEKKIEKLKRKTEKATNKNLDIQRLGLETYKHRRKIGHVRSDFLTETSLEDDNKSECDSTHKRTEMIKGDEVIPFDSYFKDKPPDLDLEKPLLYKVHQDLVNVSPPKSLPQSMTTVTTEKQLNKQPNYLKIYPVTNNDINSKGIFRYALSKPEFIEKGYTKLPSIKVIRRMNFYKMVPTKPKHNWFERHKLERTLFYDTGEKLAEIDDDGYGRWYYKNGILALDYYKSEEERTNARYVIYSSGENDAFGNPRFITVIASFDQLGNGLVYDHQGNVRLKYNQSEGIIIDDKIGPPGKWKWHSLNDPPVLQPICLDTQLNFKERKLSFHTYQKQLVKESQETKQNYHVEQQDQAVDDKMLSVEFDNFVKQQADKLKFNFKSFQIRMKAFKINEQFSLHVVDQGKIDLIFRDGLVSMKLNLGMKLITSEIVATEMADVSDVLTPFDRDIPRSISVANIKNIIDDTKKKCRFINRKKPSISASAGTFF